MKSRLAIALILCVMMASAAAAQFGRQFRGFGPRGYPPRFANADTFSERDADSCAW